MSKQNREIYPPSQCEHPVTTTPQYIGSANADIQFYLPNAPIFPENWRYGSSDAISQLIAVNTNHWRKIVTIMAKITSPAVGTQLHSGVITGMRKGMSAPIWKDYRDTLLLKHLEAINIGANQLQPHARWHIVCGQSAALCLGLKLSDANPIVGADGKVDERILALDVIQEGVSNKVLITPYLDYRQYPNISIEVTRYYMSTVDTDASLQVKVT